MRKAVDQPPQSGVYNEPSHHRELKDVFKDRQIAAPNIKDELDLLRDILAAFESLSEDGRQRAFIYFIDKYKQYNPAAGSLNKKFYFDALL